MGDQNNQQRPAGFHPQQGYYQPQQGGLNGAGNGGEDFSAFFDYDAYSATQGQHAVDNTNIASANNEPVCVYFRCHVLET